MTLTGKLLIIKRLKSSAYGNPKYLCAISTEDNLTSFETQTNSLLGYSITNYENKTITVDLKYYRNNLTLDKIHKTVVDNQ
jgi:hypothetical protein